MIKTSVYQREVTSEAVETTVERRPRRRHAESAAPARSFRRNLGFAMDGIGQVVMTQRNFRIQLVCGVMAVGAGAWFHIAVLEWLALLIVCTLVLVLEMINTAVESSIDMVTLDYHPLAKNAKDIAAGAVLVASASAVVIGAIIFVPRIVAMLHG